VTNPVPSIQESQQVDVAVSVDGEAVIQRPYRLTSRQRIAFNAATNAGVMAAKVVATFLVAPVLIPGLGDIRYGIWMLVGSVTGYFLLAEFGVKSAVVRYVAQCDGRGDVSGINRVVNSSLVLLSGAGAAILAVTMIVAYYWRSPASIPAAYFRETQLFLVLQGLSVAMILPVSVPSAVLAGLGRFPARNAVSLASLVVRNVSLVVVVRNGGGLLAVGFALLANCLVDLVALFWMAQRCYPQLTWSSQYVDRTTLRKVGAFGAQIFAADLAFLVIVQSAPLIIGITQSSTEFITYFNVGASLKDYALTVLGAVVVVLLPAVSNWDATDNHTAIRNILAQSTRYALYFAIPIQFGLWILGYPFLALWMGREYADVGFTTLAIVSSTLVLSAASLVASRVLQGLGRVRSLAAVAVVQAILTVTLSYLLATPGQIEGVAWGNTLAIAVCAPTIIVLACRAAGFTLLSFAIQAACKPLLATAPALFTWIATASWISMESWHALIAVWTLGLVPTMLLIVFLERDIREMVIGAAASLAAITASDSERRLQD
jgi:O-antigen/teichoic acid export membrane protein